MLSLPAAPLSPSGWPSCTAPSLSSKKNDSARRASAMIRWMVGTSLKLRYLVLVIAAALIVYGMVQLPNTPLDVFPEFAPPRVEIQTPSLGLSADEVESLITVPLEQAFSGVEGLDLMRSKSIPDLSSIELLFKPGVDELRARQLVQERLDSVLARMPTWAAPPVIMPPVSSVGR